MNRRRWLKRCTAGWLWSGLIAVLLGGATAIAPGAKELLPDEISVSQAKARRDAGALMLDVREAGEWEQVHIPGAVHIPLGRLEERAGELRRNREIVVVCRSGGRSAMGRDILKKAGFTKVTSMAGGMNDWKAAGYPTVQGR